MNGFIKRSWLALAGLLIAAGPGAARAAQPAPAAPTHPVAKATFAAGCFWCVEAAFDKVPGVLSTTSGYTGGTRKNPSYEEVSAGGTGHAESVEVAYDPAKVSYEKLLDAFWHNVDPLVKDRQFCDVGHQYRSAIFYRNDTEKRLAEASKAEVQKRFKEPISDRDRARLRVLSRRGVPPGLLQEESPPLQVLPHRLRPRPAACGLWGASGE